MFLMTFLMTIRGCNCFSCFLSFAFCFPCFSSYLSNVCICLLCKQHCMKEIILHTTFFTAYWFQCILLFLALISILIAECFSALRFTEIGSQSNGVGGTVTILFLDFQFVKFSFLLVKLFSLPVQRVWLSQLCTNNPVTLLLLSPQTNCCCIWRKCSHPS